MILVQQNSWQLICLGLVPVERQSGSSMLGRARMSKAGPARIRAVLYMAAVVGTR